MAPQKRSLTVDTLRGLCLLMMTFDHLLITPFNAWQTLYRHSYGPFGFFSAAEMFFFIAGLMIGFILVVKPQFSIWQRIKKIYFANWIAILVLASLLYLFPDAFSEWNTINEFLPFIEKPWEAALLSGIFLYLPYYFDVLPLYCLFFLFVPLIAKLLRENRITTVLLLSLAFYCFGQIGPAALFEQFIDPAFNHEKLPWFDPFAWQLLFFVGVVAGYLYKKNSEARIFNPSPLVLSLLGIFLFICLGLRHYFAGETFLLSPFIEITTLGPLRALNFFIAAYFSFALLKNRTWLQIPALAFLGRHSLVVFLYHAILIYFLDAQRAGITSLDLAFQMTIFVAALASLWGAAYVAQRPRGLVLRRRPLA